MKRFWKWANASEAGIFVTGLVFIIVGNIGLLVKTRHSLLALGVALLGWGIVWSSTSKYRTKENSKVRWMRITTLCLKSVSGPLSSLVCFYTFFRPNVLSMFAASAFAIAFTVYSIRLDLKRLNYTNPSLPS